MDNGCVHTIKVRIANNDKLFTIIEAGRSRSKSILPNRVLLTSSHKIGNNWIYTQRRRDKLLFAVRRTWFHFTFIWNAIMSFRQTSRQAIDLSLSTDSTGIERRKQNLMLPIIELNMALVKFNFCILVHK